MLPPYLKNYFWDIEFRDLSPKKDNYFIIERVLEWGDPRAIKWLSGQYSKDQIKKVVSTSIRLSPKTANLWRILLRIKTPIKCLQQFFLKKHEMFWPR